MRPYTEGDVTQLRSFLLCVSLHLVPCGHPVLAVVTPVSRARRCGDESDRSDESDVSEEGGDVVFWESGGRTSRASLLSMKGTPDTER